MALGRVEGGRGDSHRAERVDLAREHVGPIELHLDALVAVHLERPPLAATSRPCREEVVAVGLDGLRVVVDPVVEDVEVRAVVVKVRVGVPAPCWLDVGPLVGVLHAKLPPCELAIDRVRESARRVLDPPAQMLHVIVVLGDIRRWWRHGRILHDAVRRAT